jgi:predicted nucleic acid-binding protein
MRRVYVDTSVLVFFFITSFNANFSSKSKEFLDKIRAGKYEGTISLFVLMELVKQIRELLVRADVCTKEDWEKAIKMAFEAIYSMPNMKIIEGTVLEKGKTDKLSLLYHSEIAWDSFNIMTKYCGKVKVNGAIFCHDGIHPVDAVHIALAKRMGCTAIATFDKDFRETDKEVPSIVLMEDVF